MEQPTNTYTFVQYIMSPLGKRKVTSKSVLPNSKKQKIDIENTLNEYELLEEFKNLTPDYRGVYSTIVYTPNGNHKTRKFVFFSPEKPGRARLKTSCFGVRHSFKFVATDDSEKFHVISVSGEKHFNLLCSNFSKVITQEGNKFWSDKKKYCKSHPKVNDNDVPSISIGNLDKYVVPNSIFDNMSCYTRECIPLDEYPLDDDKIESPIQYTPAESIPNSSLQIETPSKIPISYILNEDPDVNTMESGTNSNYQNIDTHSSTPVQPSSTNSIDSPMYFSMLDNSSGMFCSTDSLSHFAKKEFRLSPISLWLSLRSKNPSSQLLNLRSLNLRNKELTGNIPNEISILQKLEKLNLSNNCLQGNIPPEIGRLSNLKELNLSNNQLTGQIPSELSSLKNLKYLCLSNNYLTGNVPQEFSALQNLGWMSVDYE